MSKNRVKKERQKKENVFTVVPQIGGGFGVYQSALSAIAFREKKGSAKKVASALNSCLRAFEWKPKNAGRRARSKGHSFERWTANELRSVFPKARRHLEYHSSDANGVDLINTGSFKFQCKKLKRYATPGTIKEVKCDREAGETPILVTAANGKEALAVLPLRDLIDILEIVKGK